MDQKIGKTLFTIITLLILCIVLTSTSCGKKEDTKENTVENPKGSTKGSNAYFGKLSSIYQSYFKEAANLYDTYKKAETQEEKTKINAERDEKKQELEDAIAKFNQTFPLKDKELPFKVSGDLPFTVQSVKITNVDYNSVDFTIQVKMNQDIKDDKGKIKERINVYFVAFDSADKVIPDTDNWATNDGWIKLLAGTIYDAQGHWNSNRVQNMGNFDFLKIMSKADYKKL